MLDRCASVAVGAQPGGSNSTSSCTVGCSRIWSRLQGPGCVHSTPGVCQSMPRTWKQRMRRATALTGPGGSPPRVRAESSRLLATLTATTATSSAVMAIARMMNSKATIMLTLPAVRRWPALPVSGEGLLKTLRRGVRRCQEVRPQNDPQFFAAKPVGRSARPTEVGVPAGSGSRSRHRAHPARIET